MTSFTPVPYEFREMLSEELDKQRSGKVFYFDGQNRLECAEGKLIRLTEEASGMFLLFDNGHQIRIDRIITLLGRPGPAYTEYDALGNTCMECHGGYDL